MRRDRGSHAAELAVLTEAELRTALGYLDRVTPPAVEDALRFVAHIRAKAAPVAESAAETGGTA